MAKFFKDLRNRLDKFKQLDADKMAYQLTRTGNFQDLVVELNTKDQLYNKGEDSKGESLSDIGGDYSPITIEISKRKGRPKKSASSINLNDSGDFYNSFRVTPFIGGFDIDADPIKDDTNLFSEWGVDIVGLNEQNLDKIRQEYAKYFQEEISKI
jgi:hypothetical protein